MQKMTWFDYERDSESDKCFEYSGVLCALWIFPNSKFTAWLARAKVQRKRLRRGQARRMLNEWRSTGQAACFAPRSQMLAHHKQQKLQRCVNV
jgi:hypothetical protein